MRFERISVEQGLSQSSVYCILQDSQGFMWLGTEDGLNRYDGTRFTVYRHDPDDSQSLGDSYVESLYEDAAGALWVRTRDAGVDRLDRATGAFTHGLSAPPGAFSQYCNGNWSAYTDSAGARWIRSEGSGIERVDPATGSSAQYRHDPRDPTSLGSDFVRSIYEDREGLLWIGTVGGGVSIVDPFAQRFDLYQAGLPGATNLCSNLIASIFEDRSGLLWVGTLSGLSWIDRSSGESACYHHDLANPASLGDDVVQAVYEDRAGVLWVGTWSGLDRLDRATGAFTHFRGAPVRSILEDRTGILWVGTDGNGLGQFDRATGTFTNYRNIPGDGHSLSDDVVLSLYEDRAGVLWVGTNEGGLARFDREDGTFTGYRHVAGDPASLDNDRVLSIREDQAGVLWIGTWGGGLNRFDRENQRFTAYRGRDGLPNDTVVGILADRQGNLWLSTNNGLSRFDPRRGTFRNYDAGDGLQSNEFNGGAYAQSSAGELFFGGINGLIAFDPGTVTDNLHAPLVALTALTQGGSRVSLGSAADGTNEVTFRWPDNSFEFEFAVLSYARPERNQYAYKLEGLDAAWYSQRTGRYTNLPGGTYTLRMKGSNNDGVWNDAGAAVRITVVPPFWETWWFGALAVFALAGVLIGGYRLRARSVAARTRELETLVEQRTAELRREIDQRVQAEEALRASETEKAVADERSRLARELHDAVTQTLFSVSLLAEALVPTWEADPAEGRELLQTLQRLSRGALAEMRTLLLELRPASLVETSLGSLLQQLADAAGGREGLSVTVTVENDCVLPPEIHVALYRIAQEALNNVVKHARASLVTVQLRCAGYAPGEAQPHRVELAVSDDGRGFDTAGVPANRLGLGIMQERAEAIGARLSVESRAGAGTRVTVVWENGGKPA